MSTIAATVLLLSSAASLTSQANHGSEPAGGLAACPMLLLAIHIAAHEPGGRADAHEVTEMVASGRSENEILEHYKALYGERILIVPDGRTGKVLFSLPVLAFLACSGMLF